MRLNRKFGKNATVNTPSRQSVVPFLFKTFETNTDIWELDEDFKDLQSTTLTYQGRISSMIDISKFDMELRENLIWKIKKICDTFELSDEVFYSAVLINDLQRMAKETRKLRDK